MIINIVNRDEVIIQEWVIICEGQTPWVENNIVLEANTIRIDICF